MIELHADDFGLFHSLSRRIARLVRRGSIDGVSVMVNAPDLADSMALIEDCDVKYTLHLNFVEGKALAEDIGLLTDKEGVFAPSFGKILIFSYIPIVRGRLLKQFKREISAQIDRYMEFIDEPLRLDGHCHYHMLPVVFDAMMEVINERKLQVSFVRFPDEKLKHYLRKGKMPVFKPINIVKSVVLNVLSARDRAKFKTKLNEMDDMKFMGVSYSGEMTWDNLKAVAGKIVKTYGGSENNIEILFHPGKTVQENEVSRITDAGDLAFLTSDMRDAEGKTAERFARIRKKEDIRK